MNTKVITQNKEAYRDFKLISTVILLLKHAQVEKKAAPKL